MDHLWVATAQINLIAQNNPAQTVNHKTPKLEEQNTEQGGSIT